MKRNEKQKLNTQKKTSIDRITLKKEESSRIILLRVFFIPPYTHKKI